MEILKIQKIAMMRYPYENYIPESQMQEYEALRRKNEELIDQYLELLKIEDRENTSVIAKTQETLDEIHEIEAKIKEIAREPKRKYEEYHQKAVDDENRKKKLTEQRYKSTPKLKRTLEQRVRKYFPVTDNILTAGYMMSNGDLLSFSYGYNHRDRDHREVSEAFEGLNIDDGTDGMIQFMRATGAIRLNLVQGYCGFDIEVKPTQEQFSLMIKIIRELNAKEINIDFKGNSKEFQPEEINEINKFLYKNASVSSFKTAGYIKPPKEIAEWIENKLSPYIETAWANSKTRDYKEKIESLKKRKQWYLYDLEEYKQGNIKDITPQEAKDRIVTIKSKILSEIPNHIKEIQNKIIELDSLKTVKMGGIKNDIDKFKIPEELIQKFIGESESNITPSLPSLPTLDIQIRYKASHGAHYEEDYRLIVIGLYQLILNKHDRFIGSDNRLAKNVEEAKANCRVAIEHELIHWIQDIKSYNLDNAIYGNPPKNIQDEENTYEKYWQSSPKKQEEMHPQIDDEFFTNLHDVFSELKRRLILNSNLSIDEFIKRNFFLDKLKNNNTGKYQRAIKEVFKFYNQFKESSV